MRRTIVEAAACFGTALESLDWNEAQARWQCEGCPDGVILTDWDLAVDPDDSRRYLDGCARVLVCCTFPLKDLDLSLLEPPGIELLGLPFDPDDFGESLAWLGGANLEPDWAGSKDSLQMVVP